MLMRQIQLIYPHLPPSPPPHHLHQVFTYVTLMRQQRPQILKANKYFSLITILIDLALLAMIIILIIIQLLLLQVVMVKRDVLERPLLRSN
jgi:sterol desaturase/sphingolipid hydroxylase (fatty acid hydroxylase superfamily)